MPYTYLCLLSLHMPNFPKIVMFSFCLFFTYRYATGGLGRMSSWCNRRSGKISWPWLYRGLMSCLGRNPQVWPVLNYYFPLFVVWLMLALMWIVSINSKSTFFCGFLTKNTIVLVIIIRGPTKNRNVFLFFFTVLKYKRKIHLGKGISRTDWSHLKTHALKPTTACILAIYKHLITVYSHSSFFLLGLNGTLSFFTPI